MWMPLSTPDRERVWMHPQLMTVDDVAALLRVHPHTVSERARQQEVPGIQIGSQWRFWKPTVLRVAVGTVAAERLLAEQGYDQQHEPEVVTPSELAKLLGISLTTTMALLQSGTIPAGQVGRRWRIYWPLIRDAIAAGTPLDPNSEADTRE